MKDERLYIVQMLERAERIFGNTEGGRDEFLTDPKTQDAVLTPSTLSSAMALYTPSG